jgi:hypothetical protein
VETCCILLGILATRAILEDDGVREEPGRGSELVEAVGVAGVDRADFLVLGTGSEGKGVVGGPNEGRGSVVVAIVEDEQRGWWRCWWWLYEQVKGSTSTRPLEVEDHAFARGTWATLCRRGHVRSTNSGPAWATRGC